NVRIVVAASELSIAKPRRPVVPTGALILRDSAELRVRLEIRFLHDEFIKRRPLRCRPISKECCGIPLEDLPPESHLFAIVDNSGRVGTPRFTDITEELIPEEPACRRIRTRFEWFIQESSEQRQRRPNAAAAAGGPVGNGVQIVKAAGVRI